MESGSVVKESAVEAVTTTLALTCLNSCLLRMTQMSLPECHLFNELSLSSCSQRLLLHSSHACTLHFKFLFHSFVRYYKLVIGLFGVTLLVFCGLYGWLMLEFCTMSVKLRCRGIHPDEHPVKTELERLSSYQEKLERFVDLSEAPLRPSTTLNYKAAACFIEHSLPDLTPVQRKKSMRDVNKGERHSTEHLETNTHKRRKYRSSESFQFERQPKIFLKQQQLVSFGGDTKRL